MISIIVPIYNEGENIGITLKELKEVMKKSKEKFEIIAVNDGSKDRSGKIVDSIHGIKPIHHPYNRGYGSAIKSGIRNSCGDFIAIIDADGTYPVKDFPKLFRFKGQYDMVVGSRTGKNVNIPLLRRPAKRIITSLANFLTGTKIQDLNSGMRIFRKDMAQKFYNLYPSGFSFTTTITLSYLCNDYTIKYVPINYYKRKGKSSIRPIRDFIDFTTLIVRIVTYFNPLKIFSVIGMFLLLIAIAVYLYSSIISGKVMDISVIVISLSALQVFLFGVIAELIVKRLS